MLSPSPWSPNVDNPLVLSATSQLILLPGNNWTSAETFISNGSADALNKVKNPDGSITGLVFDVHKYLDADNSCVPFRDTNEQPAEMLTFHIEAPMRNV